MEMETATERVPIEFVFDQDLPGVKKYRRADSFDSDCPFCGGRRKLNVNTAKGLFRCNKCDTSGNAVKLHALLTKSEKETAVKDIKKMFAGADSSLKVKYAKPAEKTEEFQVAPLEIRDYEYRTLLDSLTLSKRHHDQLVARGFSEEEIVKYQFKTLPDSDSEASRLGEYVTGKGLLFQYGRTPGFFVEYDAPGDIKWLHYTTKVVWVEKQRGMAMPVKTIDGKISLLHVRYDPPEESAPAYIKEAYHKYAWVSSAGLPSGCSVTGCENIHYAGDWSVPHETVYLTEGVLKATLASALSKRPFIGIAGVNNTSQLGLNLRMLKERGTKKIAICIDMDYREKPQVAKALQKIQGIIVQCGLKPVVLTWNEKYKGIDDYLFARKQGEKNEKWKFRFTGGNALRQVGSAIL